MANEQDVFDGMTEEERINAAPILIEMGAIIDVAEGNGDILGVLDPATVAQVEQMGETEDGKRTINFLKVLLGVDKPSEGPSL